MELKQNADCNQNMGESNLVNVKEISFRQKLKVYILHGNYTLQNNTQIEMDLVKQGSQTYIIHFNKGL